MSTRHSSLVFILLSLTACTGSDKDTSVCAEGTWPDVDGDGHLPIGALEDCEDIPEILHGYADDCDDRDATVYPGAEEVPGDGVDQDCDGLDEPAGDEDSGDTADPTPLDSDQDGSTDDEDCDPYDDDAFPGAVESCDGADNDCDGSTDEDDAVDALTWYADADTDGYGDPNISTLACSAPEGFTDNDLDCDDTDPTVYPYAVEVADGVDQDCDGALDEGTDATDDDGDGYSELGGDCDDTDSAVSPGVADAPYDGIDADCEGGSDYDADADGYESATYGGDDCDDADATIHPARDESADGVDEDCDGAVDESTSIFDDDLDGYTEEGGDCDDGDPSIFPGHYESCDGLDEDCDGDVDEDAWDTREWFPDRDDDGFGDADGDTLLACEMPDGAGYVADASDCDDTDATSCPDCDEVCDGLDNDCDGLVDDADPGVTDSITWYLDADGDGCGDVSSRATSCEAPSGYVSTDTDCDPDDSTVYPGAAEICDLQANDCDTVSTWGESDEYGLVSFIAEDGSVTDLSDALSTTEGTVTAYAIPESGALNFCAEPSSETTWYVNLTVDTVKVNIRAINDLGSVVLSGGRQASVVSARSATLRLDGLTLTEGTGTWAAGDVNGGGVYGYDTAVEINDSLVAGNEVTGYGGGIYVAYESLTVSNTTISSNAAHLGGGVFAAAADMSLEETDLIGNDALGGGGVNAYGGSIDMTEVLIQDNYAGASGGGIVLNGETCEMAHVIISSNTADLHGGGIYIYGYSVMHGGDAVSITENVAGYGGGGAAIDNWSVLSLSGDSEIGANQAQYGGGVYAYSHTGVSTVTLTDGASIWGNRASMFGGGVYDYGSYLSLENASITDNISAEEGGGVWSNSNRVACVGDTGDTLYGIYNNESTYTDSDGIWLASGKTIYGTTCDMSGNDIFSAAAGTAYSLGDDATFTCGDADASDGCY